MVSEKRLYCWAFQIISGAVSTAFRITFRPIIFEKRQKSLHQNYRDWWIALQVRRKMCILGWTVPLKTSLFATLTDFALSLIDCHFFCLLTDIHLNLDCSWHLSNSNYYSQTQSLVSQVGFIVLSSPAALLIFMFSVMLGSAHVRRWRKRRQQFIQRRFLLPEPRLVPAEETGRPGRKNWKQTRWKLPRAGEKTNLFQTC